jgi:hypothetical protein
MVFGVYHIEQWTMLLLSYGQVGFPICNSSETSTIKWISMKLSEDSVLINVIVYLLQECELLNTSET